MPSRIQCPQCAADFAYSPALLGRSYRCHRCEHPFTVSAPPVEELPVARFADGDGTSKPLSPPPLPSRRPAERSRTTAEEEDLPRRRVTHRDRPSGTAALIGLVAVFLVGFLVLATGIGYLLWPSPSKSAGQAAQDAAPPPAVDAPLAGERPKPLEEVMKQAPQREGGSGVPAPPAPGGLRPRPPGAFMPQPPGAFGPPPGGFGPSGMPGQPGWVMPQPQPLFPGPGFGQPRGTNAAIFPPPSSPVRVVADGPRFAKVGPLRISPPTFKGDRAAVELPGRAESLTVAGGGRLLLLHIPSAGKVVVFDVSEAKVTKEIDVADKDAKIAGGMNLFVIYKPGDNTIERWTCDKLERAFAGKSPFNDPVKALAMGAAANGPLVAALAGTRAAPGPKGGATLAFFDPSAGKEVTYQPDPTGQRNVMGLGHGGAGVGLRVSSDGSLVAGWDVGGRPGCEIHRLGGGQLNDRYRLLAPHPLFPSPDGSVLFGRGGVLNLDLIGHPPIGLGAIYYLPAVQRNFYMAVSTGGLPGMPRGTMEIFAPNQPNPSATVGVASDVDLATAETVGLDQSIVLIPDAEVLVTVAPNRTKLVLRRVDLK